MANDNRRKLFDAMQSAGYDIGSYEDFDRRMNNESDRQKFFIAVNEAGYDIGSYNDFDRRIRDSKYKLNVGGKQVPVSEQQYKDFIARKNQPAQQPITEKPVTKQPTQQVQQQPKPQPKPQPQPQPQQKGTPMTEAERRKMSQDVGGVIGKSRYGSQQTLNKLRYAQGNTGLDTKPVNLGQNRKVVSGTPTFNPNTGKIEERYITETGNEFESRGQADLVQNQTDEYNEYKNRTVDSELREAYSERDRLLREIRERSKDYDTGNNVIAPAGSVNVRALRMRNDDDIAALQTAYNKTLERITTLEAERDDDGGTQFWRGFTDAATADTWLMGIPSLQNSSQLLKAYRKMKRGEQLTPSERTMLEDVVKTNDVAGRYGKNRGKMYEYGAMTMHSLPFMLQFISLGGGLGLATGAARKGGEMLGKLATNAISKWILKQTGRVVGSVAGATAEGSVMANTLGAAGTTADIMQRYIGDVTIDENGNYKFDGGKTLPRAIYEGEVANSLEYGSEVLGGPMDKALGKIAGKMGLSRLTKLYERLGSSTIGRAAKKILDKMQVQSLPGEMLEEEAGMFGKAALGVDNNFSIDPNSEDFKQSVFNLENHLDVVFGIGLSMGMTQAAVTTGVGGVVGIGKISDKVAYRRTKHAVDKADALASFRMTEDKWKPLRDLIDATPNTEMKNLGAKIVADENLHYEEKRAALEYMGQLSRLRGFNLGMEAKARQEIQDAEQSASKGIDIPDNLIVNEPIIEKSEEDIANDNYSAGYDADLQGRRDIAIGLSMSPNDTMAQAAWEGVRKRIEDDADTNVAVDRERARQIEFKDENGNPDGSIRTATLRETDEDGNGKQVYIVAGNVAMTSDGTAVDTSVSDRTISIFDPSTGEPRMIDPSEIAALGSVTSAEQYDADIEQKRQDYIQQQIDEAQGTIQIVPGGSVTLPTGEEALVLGTMDADGENVLVQVGDQRDVVKRTDIQQAADDRAIEDYRQRHGIQEEESVSEEGMQNGAPSEYTNGMEIVIREQDGDYGTFSEKTGLVLRRVRAEMRNGQIEYVPDAEGNLVEYLVGDEVRHDHIADLNNMIVRYSSDVQEGETESGSPASLAGIRRERTQDRQQQDEYEPAEEYDTPIGGEVSEDEYEPAELPEYGYDEGNYERVMPMVGEGEDAEPDFLATTPQRGHRYLYEEARLPRKVADNIVSANLSAAEKELKKQQKAIDTLDGNPGTSIAQYQKKRRDLEEKLTGAQATHDYWKAVKAEQNKVVAAEAAERARQESALHEQAVSDEQRRQEQELAKRREQEERGANAVHPSIREKWDNAPKVEGAENEITLANGEIVKGRYMLVESGAATPSHNPNAEFTRNEGFPVDENGQTVNDRDYERDKDAQNITRQMAAQYDSRAIQSVPVVSRDGIVLSGNGRTMAGELAAQNNTDGAYIGHLQKYPQQFGFTTEQVQAMDHPRVVFVPDEAMPYTTDTFAKFNQQDMKSQSRTEQSVKLGKTVDDSIFNRIIQSINTFDSISDFYNDAQASTNAIAELRNAGVINAMQYAEMFDGEKVSMTGRQMLENMLVGKAFESNPDAIRQLAEYPSMRQSVISALAEISNNVALGEDYSLEGELAEAINLAYQARKSGYKAGDVVSNYARQLNLFPFDEGSETVADYTNAAVLMLADVLNDSRTGMLKKTLALYNREAADSAAGQIDMFSGGVKTKQEILKEVLNILNYGTENQQRTALAAAAEQRKADAAAGQGGGGEGVQPNGTTGESGTEGTDAAIRTAEAETDTRKRKQEEKRTPIKSWTTKKGKKIELFVMPETTDEGGNRHVKIGRSVDGGEIQPSSINPIDVSPDIIDYNATYGEDDEEFIARDKEAGTTYGITEVIYLPDGRILAKGLISGEKASFWLTEDPLRDLQKLEAEPNTVQTAIRTAEQETNTEPTEAQKEAGNYKKGHVKIDGFDVTIENPKGSKRSGTDKDGKRWEVTMNNTYGYIRGTEGVDGDHIDVFLSDNMDGWNGTVYVVDQIKADGTFDEHKVMYGFNSEQEARESYLANYSEGWQGLGAITGVSKDEFIKWIDSSHRKTKPFAEYSSVKPLKENKKVTEKNLKQFLGDWEKDPENATKAVDDKGQPIVVYRGGGRLDNIEDASNNAMYGKAYYATPTRAGAEEFAEERTGDKNNLQAAYINVRHPFVDGFVDGFNLPSPASDKEINALVEVLAKKGLKNPKSFLWKLNNGKIYGSILGHLASEEYEGRERPVGMFWHAGDIVQEALKELGYDGVIGMYDGMEFRYPQVAVFDMGQVMEVPNETSESNTEEPAENSKEWKKLSSKEIEALTLEQSLARLEENQAQRKNAVDHYDHQDIDGDVARVKAHIYRLKLDAGVTDNEGNVVESLSDETRKAILKVIDSIEKYGRPSTGSSYLIKEKVYKSESDAFKEAYNELEGKNQAEWNNGWKTLFFHDKESGKNYVVMMQIPQYRGETERNLTYYVLNESETEETAQTGTEGESKPNYTIEPATYTTKKGKELAMQLVTFDNDLTKEQKRAADKLAREKKGWFDRSKNGYMMRSETDAEELAKLIGNDAAVQEAQPVSLADIRNVTDEAESRPQEQTETAAEQPQETPQPEQKEDVSEQETASSQQQKEQKEPKSKYVSDEDAERFEQLKERLRQKLRGQMNMGIDPEIFTLGVEMTYMIVKNQARKFAEYAKAMIEEMGDAIRPYLKTFYNGARDLPELEDIAGELTPYEEVRAFDVANFDKEGAKDLIKTAEVVSKEDEANRQAEQAKEKITKSRNERLEKEMEVKRTAAHFPMETPEESAAFDRRIPDMSDEELLAYMKEDGNGDVNKAYHMNLYDEYDNRHYQEEADAYDRYLQQLRESDTTSEQAEEMLGNLHRDMSQFATEDRPLLLGQEEALQDYMSELKNERRSNETEGNSQADTDVLSLPQSVKDNPNYSKEEQESLMYRKGESMEEYGERNNKYPNNWEALYLTQKYADRMDDIANILSSLSAENADEVGKVIADIVESRSEGYELLSLLRNIPVDAVLPYQDAVSAAFEAKESGDSGKSQPEQPTLQLTSEQEEKPKKSRTTASSKGKIDDFGEKIGGARKDVARSRIRDVKNMTAKDLTSLKKGADDILSQANIIRLFKDGQMDGQTARKFLAFNNVVKVAKRKYHGTTANMTLNKYRDAAVAWEEGRPMAFEVTDEDVSENMKAFPRAGEERIRESLNYTIIEPYTMFMRMYEAIDYPNVQRKLGQHIIMDYTIRKGRMVTKEYPYWVMNGYGAMRGFPFKTLEGAVNKLKELCPEIKEGEKKEKGEKAEHGLRVVKEDYRFYIKSRNIPGNIYLSPSFWTEREAQDFLNKNLERLKEREQSLVISLMGSNIGMAEREGVDYRNGKDVKPQDFLDEFGFRGVEFGNWVPQGERQMYLNKTYDAIKDFCAIVGISPRAFSLGGRLGLAFGARGKSRAMAHYEPLKEVINLTRMSGVGSLAHEWFHAVDNYLAKQKTGNMSDMATVTHDVTRQELSDVFKELYDAMKSMDYANRSRRAGDYWGKTEEEFARLFESYIYNKLAEKEMVSPILVRKDVLLDDVDENIKGRWPYPSKEENEKMQPYFDKLFDTIQEKTDKNGNVVLFQRVDDSAIRRESDAVEKAMRDEVVRIMREAGIEVSTDWEAGQRILNDANAGLREMRAYHGSGADFNRFDHSFIGTGEGAQAFGWGTYVSEVEGVGRGYAKRIGDMKASERRFIEGKIEEAKRYNIPAQVEYWENELKRKNLKNAQHYLYEVEIPKDDGGNYIDYFAKMQDQQGILDKIDNYMTNNEVYGFKWIRQNPDQRIQFRAGNRLITLTPNQSGADLYEEFKDAFGAKPASEILHAMGITGIKVPVNTMRGGNEKGEMNYVIFNENDLQITDRLNFFRTSSGEAYGFTLNGKVYLDPRIATAETPIHEYAHLWAQALRKANPKAWDKLKSEIQKEQDVVDYVKRLYPDITNEDELLEEVFTHYGGRRGAEMLRQQMQYEMEKADGATEKAKVKTIFDKLRDILSKFWNMARDLFAGNNKNLACMKGEDFADMMMNDLINGFNPNVKDNSGVREQRGSLDYELSDFKKEKGLSFLRGVEKADITIGGKRVGRVFKTDEGYYAETPMYDFATETYPTADDAVKALLNRNDTEEGVLFRDSSTPVFYSNAARAVEQVRQEKATPEQWLKMIEKNGGLKSGEDKWIGLSDWLKESKAKSITKQEVMDYILSNQIQIEETGYGDKTLGRYDEHWDYLRNWLEENTDNPDAWYNTITEYYGYRDGEGFFLNQGARMPKQVTDMVDRINKSIDKSNPINSTRLSYTTKGLENKREIALTVPTIESWNTQDEIHFGDAGQGRAVAWVRFGETTDADGNRVLVIDEIQSKRHQEGREKGYYNPDARRAYTKWVIERAQELGVPLKEYVTSDKYKDEREGQKEALNNTSKGEVPSAPFEKNWHELAMKRMLRYAAENGYDKVAWTTGEQQVERYDLRRTVQKISSGKWDKWNEDDVETKYITIDTTRGDTLNFEVDRNGIVTKVESEAERFGVKIGSQLSDIVGKDLSKELLLEEPKFIRDNDLRIGGEGMKGFYDKMLPSFMNKYGKKWGVKVGTVELPNVEESARTMWSIDVTPEMVQSVMEGQPMFRIREDAPPTKTGTGYKVFVLKDGKLYPPKIANPNGEATPVGVWLDADAAPVVGFTKTGRPQVKAGGKGTDGGSGKLAYRPGWHLGEIPYALQFDRVNPETGQRELFPANFVWAEVEYADDVDYQEEAMSYGINENGKFQHSFAGLPRVPENGSYKYRTNPNPDTDPWIITGAMKVNRILKPSEVDAMVEAAGREPQQRQAGAITDEQVEALNTSIRTAMQEDSDMKRSVASQLGDRLNTPLNIIEDVNDITHPNKKIQERQRRSKGWYDPVTGQVYVVLPNNRDVDDVKATIGHETVAHKGLRELVGEQRYAEFLDETYKHLRDDLKQEVDDAAGREFLNGLNNNNGRKTRSYEECRRIAVDELFGRMAEKPFEEFSEGERTLWQRIKDAVRKILDKFLGSLKLPDWFELGDNELRYILWRSKERLERGKESPMDFARDIVKREELGLTSDDIRFRDSDDATPRALARDTYERLVLKGSEQFMESVQDSMRSLKNLYRAINEAEGKKKHIEDVEGYENAYLAENRMHSASQAQIDAWEHDFILPLVKTVNRMTGGSKSSYSDLIDYMMAKHGLERNRVLALRDFQKYQQENPKGTATLDDFRDKDYSGLTALTGESDVPTAESIAQTMVDDYEREHDLDITELWDRVNAATKSSLNKLFMSGMMSKERYEQIRDMFQYYIPLQGFDNKVAEDVYAYVGSDGTRMYGTPIRTAKGRKSKADDPLATIEMNGEAAIRQGNRNIMKQRFLNFVQNHPSDLVSVSDVWLRHNDVTDEWEQYFDADLKEDDTPDEVERKTREFEERMKQLAESDPDHYKRGRDLPDVPYRVLFPNDASQHQVLVRRNGKTFVLTINANPRAAQALNGLTNPDVFTEGAFGKIMNFGQSINRQLSALYTTRNPEFVASNFMRDAIYSNSMVWVKEGANYALNFHKNFGKMNPAFMAMLFEEWENGKLRKKVNAMPSGKVGQIDELRRQFHEFMMNGGETGWTSIRDIEKHKRDLERAIRREGSVTLKTWKALGGMFDLANRSVENCARFAAYITSREMGRSIDRSIFDAKEISVNFNKKGAGDKFISAKGQTKLGWVGSAIGGIGRGWYVFFNASLQGLNNIARATGRHPFKAAGLVTTLFTLGSVIPMLSALVGGDDDDDKDSYYNLPEYIRRSNVCFRWRNDMPWVTIPLPIEFRAIYGLGELSTGVLTGKERYSNEELTRQFASQISQVLPLDFMEGGGGLHAFIPSQIKPLVEAYSNKSWTGLPIYRDNKFKPYAPQWTLAYSNASQQLVTATRWLNEATGGSDVTQGYIDWNPARIEYMLKGYLGGVFTMYDRLEKSAETILGQRDFEWRNVPIASRVLKQGDERTAARKARNEYFNLLKEYDKTKTDLNELRKIAESDREDALSYAKRIDYLHNSRAYTHYLIMDSYKPLFDAYYKMEKTADDIDRRYMQQEEDALRRELIDLIHAVDDGKEVDIDARIMNMVKNMMGSEREEVSKAAMRAAKHHDENTANQ